MEYGALEALLKLMNEYGVANVAVAAIIIVVVFIAYRSQGIFKHVSNHLSHDLQDVKKAIAELPCKKEGECKK